LLLVIWRIAVVPHLVERKESGFLDRAAHVGAERTIMAAQTLSYSLKPKPMPLIEATGTTVERITPERLKSWITPVRQLRQHVGRPAELAVGKNLNFPSARRTPGEYVHCLLELDVH